MFLIYIGYTRMDQCFTWFHVICKGSNFKQDLYYLSARTSFTYVPKPVAQQGTLSRHEAATFTLHFATRDRNRNSL